MGKLDDLERAFTANVDRSLGQGQPPAQSAQGMTQDQFRGLPERLKGLVKSKDAAEISVDRISADPDQPREVFDEEALDRLAESLKVRGVLQPLRVRWSEVEQRYILIAGERRWRAALKAGLASVPCVIQQGEVDPGELLALQLIENCLREDLSPVEQAKGYKRLMELHGWSARQVAKELGLAPSSVARALELLDLPVPIQDLVVQGSLKAHTACEIGRLDGPPHTLVELAERAVQEGLPRSAVVAEIKARKEGKARAVKSTFTGGTRAEIRLDDGHKIILSGPTVSTGDEALVILLRRGLEQLQARLRAAS